MISYTHSGSRITINLDRPVTISETDKRFPRVLQCLKDSVTLPLEEAKQNMQQILNGIADPKYVESVVASGTNLEIKNGKVFLDGKQVHNSIATRIEQFIEQELPFEHMMKFLANIQENPSFSSQNELYDFLEYKDLPITEDGYLLAYKSVTRDFLDWHTHTVDNSVGAAIPRMKRSDVDDDRTVGCSKGYHAGSIEYVKSFNPSGHTVIVKIHPADVVSVPKDCSCQKIRVCWYQVISVMEKVFEAPLCTAEGKEQTAPVRPRPSWDEIERSYDAEQKASWADEEYEEDDDEDDYAWDDDEDDYDEDDDYDSEYEDDSDDEDDYPLPKRL